MIPRRSFLLLCASAATGARRITARERLNRVLRGQSVDRVPFSFWHHFGLQASPPERHAQATLEFHRKFRTDLVKVMSDYPFPKPQGKWYEIHVQDNPFPKQLRALELIRDGLNGQAYFIETIFNPWNVAEKLSSPEEVRRLKDERPSALLEALEAIAESEVNHARKAIATGAAGIFLAIANAQERILSRQEYSRFSEPFDRMILKAVPEAPLNTLHLHGDKVYLDYFTQNWPVSAINYSVHGTGVPLAEVRKRFAGVLMGGLDERAFRNLTPDQMRTQWKRAQEEAGKRFILTPGCSVPDDTTDAELLKLVKLIGA